MEDTSGLANSYGYKIENGNLRVDKNLARYIGMRNTTPKLEQSMKHLATLDTSLNMSQHECGCNTTTTMKASARKMHSEKGGTTGTTGQAKDDGLTCYHCCQVGHISRKCPNRDMMKKQLDKTLVSKDVAKT
jgi:hypothetical protein